MDAVELDDESDEGEDDDDEEMPGVDEDSEEGELDEDDDDVDAVELDEDDIPSDDELDEEDELAIYIFFPMMRASCVRVSLFVRVIQGRFCITFVPSSKNLPYRTLVPTLRTRSSTFS